MIFIFRKTTPSCVLVLH